MNPKGLLTELVRRISILEKGQRDLVGNKPLFYISNEFTPTTLSGDQNNYDIGFYDVLRMSSTLGINITGLQGGKKGRSLRVLNVGSFSITFKYENASSDAANRIHTNTAGDLVVVADGWGEFYYDSTISRWRAVRLSAA